MLRSDWWWLGNLFFLRPTYINLPSIHPSSLTPPVPAPLLLSPPPCWHHHLNCLLHPFSCMIKRPHGPLLDSVWFVLSSDRCCHWDKSQTNSMCRRFYTACGFGGFWFKALSNPKFMLLKDWLKSTRGSKVSGSTSEVVYELISGITLVSLAAEWQFRDSTCFFSPPKYQGGKNKVL